MIKFAIVLIAIAVACALLPEILRRTEAIRARLFRHRRDGEMHVLKADPADAIWSRRARRRREAAKDVPDSKS